MGVRTIKLDLDICKKNYLTVDTVKSLDSIIFKISIFENGISKDITRQTVALYCKRKNNSVVEQKDNISVSNNLITVNVKNSCFQVPGTALFELELKDSSGTIATMNFSINVEARLNSSEVISATNEISGLNAVVKNLENKAQQLDNTIVETNTKLNSSLISINSKGDNAINAIKKDYENLKESITGENIGANLQEQINSNKNNLADLNKKIINTYTKTEVDKKIQDAQLNSGDGDINIDLSNYVTKEDLQRIELTPGPKGERGEQGIQGPKGEQGPIGLTGPKGDTGERGPQGLTGERGEQGIQGPKGNDGRDATLTTEQTENLAQIPTLKDKLDNTYTKTEVDKKIQDAQLNNNDGNINIDLSNYATKEDLQRIELTPGPKGERGEQGIQGPKGEQGPIGLTGPKGDTGERGPQGLTGERGEQGIQGPKGEQGPIGLTGPKGNDGTFNPNTTFQELKTESKTVIEALNEVFINASNGKSLIAEAITGKGIIAQKNETFENLSIKIKQIKEFKELAKLDDEIYHVIPPKETEEQDFCTLYKIDINTFNIEKNSNTFTITFDKAFYNATHDIYINNLFFKKVKSIGQQLSTTYTGTENKLKVKIKYKDVTFVKEYFKEPSVWVTKAELPINIKYLTSEAIGDKIYAIGGDNLSTIINIVYKYDTKNDKWVQDVNMPKARQRLASSSIGEKIYVLGGYSTEPLKNNECYNTLTSTWTAKNSMITARYDFCSNSINNNIYVFGGNTSTGITQNVECYNALTDTWTLKSNTPTKRAHTSSSVKNNNIYIIGGYYSSASKNNECYNTLTDTWTTKTAMSTARYNLEVVTVNNNIYAIGGNTGKTVERYNIADNKWETVASLNYSRESATASVVDGEIYVIGGSSTRVTEVFK